MLNSINQLPVVTGILGSASGKTIFTTPMPIKICSIRVNVTTTATVGNRNFFLVSADNTGLTNWKVFSTTAQTASVGYSIVGGSGLPNQVSTSQVLIPLPNPAYVAPGGSLFIVDLSNIDVNDNVVSGQLLFEF